MKGIAHFLTGVTAASFFPWSVEAALRGQPWYFVIGGAFGLLPDTLDFKFYRFFYRHDDYIEPMPGDLDPQPIAERLADAIARAARERRPVRVKLGTVRLGADRWRQYQIRFDAGRGEVAVRFGPEVSTGQVPIPGTEPRDPRVGRAKLAAPIRQTYDAVTTVDIFDGPSFAFEPDETGRVVIQFLPWHREWSHSFTVGALLALMLALGGHWRAGLVALAGYAGHLLEDQLGFMGSNLAYPFTKRRLPGAHVMRSGDALPNFLTVWLCLMLLFWNLYMRTPTPVVQLSFARYVLYAGVGPWAVMALAWYLARRGRPVPPEAAKDMGDEWEEALVS